MIEQTISELTAAVRELTEAIKGQNRFEITGNTVTGVTSTDVSISEEPARRKRRTKAELAAASEGTATSTSPDEPSGEPSNEEELSPDDWRAQGRLILDAGNRRDHAQQNREFRDGLKALLLGIDPECEGRFVKIQDDLLPIAIEAIKEHAIKIGAEVA